MNCLWVTSVALTSRHGLNPYVDHRQLMAGNVITAHMSGGVPLRARGVDHVTGRRPAILDGWWRRYGSNLEAGQVAALSVVSLILP